MASAKLMVLAIDFWELDLPTRYPKPPHYARFARLFGLSAIQLTSHWIRAGLRSKGRSGLSAPAIGGGPIVPIVASY